MSNVIKFSKNKKNRRYIIRNLENFDKIKNSVTDLSVGLKIREKKEIENQKFLSEIDRILAEIRS